MCVHTYAQIYGCIAANKVHESLKYLNSSIPLNVTNAMKHLRATVNISTYVFIHIRRYICGCIAANEVHEVSTCHDSVSTLNFTIKASHRHLHATFDVCIHTYMYIFKISQLCDFSKYHKINDLNVTIDIHVHIYV